MFIIKHSIIINHKLKLEERTWEYPECGNVHERDDNAALNLYHYIEDNAKIAIKNVLAYNRKKKLLDKDKIVMNKNLNL